MTKSQKKRSDESSRTLHPGSSAEDAKAVGGKGDFGVREDDVVERTYTSENTKHSDPGSAVARSGEDDSRTSGAGGANSGPGSSSGGDLDTDIIGLGTGGGIAASGSVHEPPGPDDATGTSRDFASGKPAKGEHQNEPLRRIRESTVQQTDASATDAQGADAASHAKDDSDSFAGEVSSDEASGRNDAGG